MSDHSEHQTYLGLPVLGETEHNSLGQLIEKEPKFFEALGRRVIRNTPGWEEVLSNNLVCYNPSLTSDDDLQSLLSAGFVEGYETGLGVYFMIDDERMVGSSTVQPNPELFRMDPRSKKRITDYLSDHTSPNQSRSHYYPDISEKVTTDCHDYFKVSPLTEDLFHGIIRNKRASMAFMRPECIHPLLEGEDLGLHTVTAVLIQLYEAKTLDGISQAMR